MAIEKELRLKENIKHRDVNWLSFNERVLRGMLVADVLTLKSRFRGYHLQNDVVVRVGH